MRSLFTISGLLLSFLLKSQSLEFVEFNEKTFQTAQAQNKYVLLDLKANWCHWCHVMDDSTYSNPEVIQYLNAHFIVAKADQDENPALANQYRNYGWPATVAFSSHGAEIDKKRGYMNPREFLLFLKILVESPSSSIEALAIPIKDSLSTESKKQKVMMQLENFLDFDLGGYAQSQKYVDYDAYEYAFAHYKKPRFQKWITKSVEGAYQLEDSVWSGIFQYSTNGDWKHVHFEKLLSIQARYIEIFVDHYVISQSEKSLASAKKVAKYCDRFLKRPNGLYASSQDADLRKGIHSQAYYSLSNLGRLQRGIPPIDPNTYTQTNAAMAVSLLRLGLVSQNKKQILEAKELLDILSRNRLNQKGLYFHSAQSTTTALADNLAMTRAFQVFYNLTGEEFYQERGIALMKAMKYFRNKDGSFSDPSAISVISPSPIISENIKACRLFNMGGHLFNQPEYVTEAQNILKYLLSPKPFSQVYVEGALALAIDECNSKPKNIVVIIDDCSKQPLLEQAANLPISYFILEVTKQKELSSKQVELFGEVEKTTVFSCTENACSSPITQTDQLFNLLL